MPTLAIAPAMNADGRLEILALDTALQTVWHIMQVTPNGNWGAWERLTEGVVGIGQLQVAKNADGRLEWFTGPGSIFYRAQVTPSGNWTGVGGLLGGAVGLSQFAVGANADGRLEVFAVDGDAGLAGDSQRELERLAEAGRRGGPALHRARYQCG